MILNVIFEGLGLGILLILVCAVEVRNGAVGMVHLYSEEVQNRCVDAGMTTHEKISAADLTIREGAATMASVRYTTLTFQM